MHKLNRPQAVPKCLNQHQRQNHQWSALSSEDKSKIWQQLDKMQGNRCAYCENTLKTEKNKHIEHFYPRRLNSKKCFEWTNLFGSCNDNNRCGKYKDQHYLRQNQQANAMDSVIKMDEQNPEDYLQFLPDGQVIPRTNLDSACKKKAQTTIDCFNLNGPLRKIRERHLKGYQQTAKNLYELALEYPEEGADLIKEEVEKTKDFPFATAIKHLLVQPK